MAIKDLRDKATQLVSYGEYPALATRVSIPNVNLLNTKGSILYGTGNPATSDASIDGTTYQYAEAKALNPTSVKSVLFNDGSGNLSWTNVVDNLTTNDGNKILSAKVGYDIDSKIHISEAGGGAGISMGYHSSSGTNAGNVAIGINATSSGSAGVSIGNVSWVTGNNSTAIGNAANAFGDGCVAIGGAFHKSDTIKGGAAKAGTDDGSVYSAIQLGSGTNTISYSFQVFNTPMLVDGKIPQTSIWPEINTSGTVNIGMNISGSTDCVAIGNNTVGAKNSVAIGKRAEAKKYGTAIGSASTTLAQSIAGEDSVAVGYGAQASGKYCVAIGSGAITGPESNEYYIQIGNIGVGMTMNVGKYELMGSDGYIKPKRLSIYKHHIYWDFGYSSRTYILYFDIYNYNATKYTESDMVSVAGFKGLFVCNGLCTDNYSRYCPMVEIVFSSTPSSTGIVTNNITLKYIENGIKQITIPSADIVTSSFEDSVSNIFS